jgi:fructokinase
MSPTIAVIGEIVADAVLPPDGIVDGVAHLAVHPGGGPANTAVALARLGTTARFAGRLTGGALGALCRAKLEASGVDLTTSVVVDNPATLAIARLDSNGAASYEFYTEGTADWGWTDDSLAPVIDGPYPPSGPPVAVHTGTLALALQPSGAVIENLLGRARDRMTVSVDPNLRTQLIPAIIYRQRIDVWAALSDIIRLSEDDLEQLWPGWAPEQAAAHLHQLGVTLVVVSLGAAGAFASLRGDQLTIPIAPTTLVDTVGAGDSFHAGLLHHLAQLGVLGGRLDTLTTDHLEQSLRFASRVAAINCSRPGADPPWHTELE